MIATTDLQLGDALTRWSVRIAIACYLVRVFLDLRLFLDLRSQRRLNAWGQRTKARWFWTCGCALYVLHVVCAFVFYHNWSHLAAYRHTAEQTAAVTGIHWGGGLYINYAFTAFWLTDLAAWWLRGVDFPYRSSRYFWTLHGVFAFMVLNATVVFGPPIWKYIAIVIATLSIVVLRNRNAHTS